MKHGTKSVGHPVDVATGDVYFERHDISLPGAFPLQWTRFYSTALIWQKPTLLGHAWTSAYLSTLSRDAAGLTFSGGPLGITNFPDPTESIDGGGVLRDLGSFREVGRHPRGYAVTTWDPESGEILRFVFADGADTFPLTRIENASGHGVDLVRDNAGRILSIRDQTEQRTLVLEYGGSGQLKSTSMLLSGGVLQPLARYEYDTKGRLHAAYDALGQADWYEYDDSGRLTREGTKDGGVYSFRYDDRGRCTWTSGQEHYDEKWLHFRSDIGFTRITDGMGGVHWFQWLPTGQVTTNIDPLGGVTRTSYDEHGRIITRTDPIGAKAKYGYDDKGNRNLIVDPLGQEIAFKFDDRHLPLTMKDKAENVWSREYDAQGRMVASADPAGRRWKIEYDEHGRISRITDAVGGETKIVFSPDGHEVWRTSPSDKLSIFLMDDYGNVVSWVDATGNRTHYEYDLLGHTRRITYPDGSTRKCDYDANNNITRLTDGNQHTLTWRYGPCGRLLEQSDGAGNRTQFEWGTEPDLLLKVIKPDGEAYEYQYDACGRIVREIGFDGRVMRFRYNAAGSCIAFTQDDGEATEFTFDAIGRVVKAVGRRGDETVYEYNPVGYIALARNSTCAVRFKYDEAGNVVRETIGEHSVESKYDGASRRTQVKSSLGFEGHFRFDAEGRFREFATPTGLKWQSRHDASGHESALTLPGGILLKQAWDTVGRMTSQTLSSETALAIGRNPARSPGSTGFGRRMDYDNSYNVVRIADEFWGGIEYSYDAANRPVAASTDRWGREEFTYTDDGSLARSTDTTRGTRELTYGPGSRLLRDNDVEYEHDKRGRILRKSKRHANGSVEEWLYTWDRDERLTKVVCPSGAVWRYFYDAFGRRVRKEGPGRTIEYVWDRDVVLHERENGQEPSTWIFDPLSFRPLASLRGSQSISFVCDHLGTPRAAVDNASHVLWAGIYRVWGETRQETGDAAVCPIRFQGQWLDAESGLCYNRYRYYDPCTARYISPDPIRLFGGIGLYTYALNPLRFVDPFGLNTPPTLPPRVLLEGNDVQVVHNYNDMAREHADPIHFHVFHQDGESKIRADGTLLPGEPALSKQAKDLLSQPGSISRLRRAEDRIARTIRANDERPGGRPFRAGKRGDPAKRGGCGR